MKFEAPQQPSPEEVAKIEKDEVIAEEGPSSESDESLKEIEAIQTEEKGFLSKIKESARDAFHFAPKESFKKVMRTVALATVLLAPIGEKAFAERAESPKEQTVAMAQIDQESSQLEQEQDSESLDPVTEQKELIKEKYDKEIIFAGDYSIEELQELDEALEIVQNLVPKKFDDLKLGFIKPDIKALKGTMVALTNVVNGLEELNMIIDKSNDNFDIVNTLFNKHREDSGEENNYEIILMPNKNGIDYDRKALLYFDKVAISNRESFTDSYRDGIVHELCHAISMNNQNSYKELENKFDKINSTVIGSRTIDDIRKDVNNPELKRPNGCVSTYAIKAAYIKEKASSFGNEINKAKYDNSESIAEVLTYMGLKFDYADNDSAVQEKIKIVKNFLAESNDNEKNDSEEKETEIKLAKSDADNLDENKDKNEKVKEQKYKPMGLDIDKIEESFPFLDVSDLFGKK